LTEEGLPFLILFHHIDDTETPEKFKGIVARELLGEKSENFFY
jgi:endoplasmic reticulum resident protein 44